MLCGEAPRDTIEQLQPSISSDLEPVDVHPVNRHLIDPAGAGGRSGHATSSIQLRTPRTHRRPGWWSWLDRPLQRIALREIADDPHLLSDLGLTREEALREAAKPFWR